EESTLAKLENEFKQNGGKWEEFRIGDLFELFELKKLNPLDTREFRVKEQDESHPIPAVVAKVGDNGIMYYVGKDDFETTKNKLVVIGDGAVASGLVYYQGQEFTILHNAYAIMLKMPTFETRQNYLFLACALQKAIFDFFGYENKPTWNKVKECKIKLPTLKNGQIAFEFMEQWIRELEAERIRELEA
ncbi:restriction endonuclease subunit S, partial [Campylobacter troglodytis]|uniref:restriction endonuclease subunit S n=1 Tax=Campylobacter troglodytis TaxID=654363 RepID=UPI00115918A8